MERHATGWQLSPLHQIVVAWNAVTYTIEDDGGESTTEIVGASVFLVLHDHIHGMDKGGSGYIWRHCDVMQYFDREYVGFIQDECTTAETREFTTLVASCLPEATGINPSVLLALTVWSPLAKLRLHNHDDNRLSEDEWTMHQLIKLIQPSLSKFPAADLWVYDARGGQRPLEKIDVWFNQVTSSHKGAAAVRLFTEQISKPVAKWIRSVQSVTEPLDEGDDSDTEMPWLE